MGTMRYKPSDKVRIKNLDWYNENKDEYGYIDCGSRAFFTKMSDLCGKIATIKEICKTNCYRLEEYDYDWTDEMIEGLVEELLDNDMEEHQKIVDEIMAIQGIEPIEAEMEEVWHCPDGYIFKDENGNVINATEIVLEKKTNEEMIENNTKVDMGEVSDGYHTFNELYEYRMLYNAALFNEFAKQGLYDVHKSRKHSDGEYPFGDSNWFIVMAELPMGQISNHYEMKDWDKFQIPEKPLANKWDEHSPRDVAERLTSFTNPKKEYPKTYEECLKIMGIKLSDCYIQGYKSPLLEDLQELLICRDAYWKIAGEEMGLGKPWEPDWTNQELLKYCIANVGGQIKTAERYIVNTILAFPTEEMRDAFKENFDPDIEFCKELL